MLHLIEWFCDLVTRTFCFSLHRIRLKCLGRWTGPFTTVQINRERTFFTLNINQRVDSNGQSFVPYNHDIVSGFQYQYTNSPTGLLTNHLRLGSPPPSDPSAPLAPTGVHFLCPPPTTAACQPTITYSTLSTNSTSVAIPTEESTNSICDTNLSDTIPTEFNTRQISDSISSPTILNISSSSDTASRSSICYKAA